MADELYLSLWLPDFRAGQMVRHYEKMVRQFPFSQLRPGISLLRAYVLEFAEPPVMEVSFSESPSLEEVFRMARRFDQADCALEIEGWWDLWQYEQEWRLWPAHVGLFCFGPAFDSGEKDHLRIDLGIDSLYLPEPGVPLSGRKAQSNLKGLIRLVHELDRVLRPAERRLWLESGEDFAGRLEDAVS